VFESFLHVNFQWEVLLAHTQKKEVLCLGTTAMIQWLPYSLAE